MHCAKCYFFETDVGDDVCNRCGRAYLPEANVYLGLIVLATGGAAWTLRHLLTGDAGPLARPTVDLGAWATWPVSIVDSPAWGLVVGLWLAMLAAAPVLTALLYGKRGGWLLAIVIAAVGPSVAMAAAAAVGVWIAAAHVTRLQSKLASALLGLAPAALYWIVATALTDFSKGEPAPAASEAGVLAAAAAARTLPPALRALAWVPALAAIVAAAAAAAMVVAVGWADRWHVRWPGALVTVLVAAPVLALLALVGIDEVRYGMFLASPTAEAAEGRAEADLLQEFLRRHPSSPRAAQVRARLAEHFEKIESGALPGDPPRPAAEVWKELLAQNPTSLWAADARLHLGDADARQGLFPQAEQDYRAALVLARPREAAAEDPLTNFNVFWDYFSIGRDLRARDDARHLERVRADILARLALLTDNRRDTQDNSRALALAFVALFERGTNRYREALLAARDADPQGALADNVAFDLAMLEPDDEKRVAQLDEVIKTWPDTDGALLARLKAAAALIARAAATAGGLGDAQRHLLAAQADLVARKARDPLDPRVVALMDRVEKELVYVQAQLRTPAARP